MDLEELRELRSRLNQARDAYHHAEPGRELCAAREAFTEIRDQWLRACAEEIERQLELSP